MRHAVIAVALLSSPVYANACLDLSDSGDGVPAAFFQEKCYAEEAFEKGDYAVAAAHYEKASAVRFHEAPNYSLRLDWAESLCLAGDKKKGLEVLNSFVLMAKAELEYFECPENITDIPPSEHMQLACIGYGSVLSDEGEVVLKRDLERADKIRNACNNA